VQHIQKGQKSERFLVAKGKKSCIFAAALEVRATFFYSYKSPSDFLTIFL
jgi:hypothetical protein